MAVGAELPSAMRQRAVLNDEIRRRARRYLDRQARRRIAVRNVPIPDRLDEVGDSGGGPDAPRKALGNDVFAAAIGWLQLPLRKTDRLCRYHEKAPCCGKSRKKLKPNATPIAELRVQTLNSHQRANCDGAYERPADALLSGSMSDCAEKGLVRNAMHPEPTAALRTAGSSFPVM